MSIDEITQKTRTEFYTLSRKLKTEREWGGVSEQQQGWGGKD